MASLSEKEADEGKALTDLEGDEVWWWVGLSGVCEEDVLGLEVSMHDAFPVECPHRLGCYKTIYRYSLMIYLSLSPTYLTRTIFYVHCPSRPHYFNTPYVYSPFRLTSLILMS